MSKCHVACWRPPMPRVEPRGRGDERRATYRRTGGGGRRHPAARGRALRRARFARAARRAVRRAHAEPRGSAGPIPIAALIARIEAHLEENPKDGRGWEVVAPVYMKLERYDDAVKARRNAINLLGETAARDVDLGEAMTAAANGVVSDEAKVAFDRAIKLDADHFKAMFYLGLAAQQDGNGGGRAHLARAHRQGARGRAVARRGAPVARARRTGRRGGARGAPPAAAPGRNPGRGPKMSPRRAT